MTRCALRGRGIGTATSDVQPMARCFDAAAIAGYLEGRIDGFRGPVTIRKFDMGQSNPTFRLDTPDRSFVLRRKVRLPAAVLAPLLED